ncbi:6561_t:CDS:2 [Paraglomus brasilianum]|uniref:6561_t:CDS:1 n=1 Tax=Paraglomus brasilianum TaxID=144538 RepID=A0A9N9AVN1_9GLOM|nr:6561_t:CDS:2 [Paraglomus brasilianum]
MRTEDFFNPVEEREIEELVDEKTIIQLIHESRDEGEDNVGDEEGNESH